MRCGLAEADIGKAALCQLPAGVVRVDGGDLREQQPQLALNMGQHGVDQRFLILEMAVGRGAGEVARRRDTPQGKISDAVRLQLRQSGVEQLLPHRGQLLFGVHRASSFRQSFSCADAAPWDSGFSAHRRPLCQSR